MVAGIPQYEGPPLGPRPGEGGGAQPGADPFILDPLIVEVGNEAGDLMQVGWAGHAWVVRQPLDELPTASIEVRLDRGWGVNAGTAANPVFVPLHTRVNDAQRIRIRTARPSPSDDIVLIDGFVEAIRYSTQGGRSATLNVVAAGDVLRTEWLVHGQWWINKAGQTGADTAPVPIEVDALDCVFNPDGAGNRRALLHRMNVAFPDDFEGTPMVMVPLFTHTRDPNRKLWTWAGIFVHLLARGRFYGTYNLNRLGRAGADGFREIVGEDHMTLWQRIKRYGYDQWDPDLAPDAGDPWARALCAVPMSHSIEGLSWLDALKWTCARSGVHFAWDCAKDASGQTYWGPRFVVPGAARSCTVFLPSTDYAVHGKTWAQVVEDANVTSVNLEQSFREVVNCVALRGAANRHEVTIELVPGWAPNSDWDVDPGNAAAVQAAVDAALTDGWASKYNTNGGAFESGGNTLIGRLWGVNTWGAWTAFGRGFGPFQSGRYTLFDFKDVRLNNVVEGHEREGENTVRPRTWRQCLSGLLPNYPYSPRVEVSWDSGSTWFYLAGDVYLSQSDLRIYLETEDLRNVICPAGSQARKSLVEAYIRGTLRIRITAGFEHDAAIGLDDVRAVEPSGSRRLRKLLVQRKGDWQLALRDDDPIGGGRGGNSQWNRSLYPNAAVRPAQQRNDSERMVTDAVRLLAQTDRVRWRGPIMLAGIVLPGPRSTDCSTMPYGDGGEIQGYRAGDVVEQIAAEDTSDPCHDLPLAVGGEGSGAVIAEVSLRYQLDPPAFSTTLQLEDWRRAVSMEGA